MIDIKGDESKGKSGWMNGWRDRGRTIPTCQCCQGSDWMKSQETFNGKERRSWTLGS